jgi:GNAT superfamily N-acetyltransferase
MLRIVRTDSDDKDFVALVRLLDADLAERDGEDHAFYAQYNKIAAIKHVIVAYHNEVAVGCGAFKKYAEGIAEVKRMYVKPGYRRQGIAQMVLKELEKWSAEAGYQTLILETGKAQPEAIALYKASGYERIPNYGQYEHVENSVCMKKESFPSSAPV